MPRFMVPVSTRTMKGTLAPAEVVVVETSAGIALGLVSGLKSLPPLGMYT